MQQTGKTRVRTRVDNYTSTVVITVSAFVFLWVVPLLPGSPGTPVLALLVALGLGVVSLRDKGLALAMLYLLAIFSILWQLIGFGFFQLFATDVGVIVVVMLMLPLLGFLRQSNETAPISLAILAVALMLTPEYYLSVPMMVAAVYFGGLESLGVLSSTFVFLLTPLLLLENGIYFTTVPNSANNLPIVFAQLTHLSQNIRPALPGLNVFLTGIPSDYVSVDAPKVAQFFLYGSSVMIIPILVFSIVISASASIAGLTSSALRKLSVFDKTRNLVNALSPLAVAVVTPLAFTVLIDLMAQPGVGGFYTSFSGNVDYVAVGLMEGCSVGIGGAFTGLEFYVQKSERVELAQDKISAELEQVKPRIILLTENLKKISDSAPSIDLDQESKALSEFTSLLSDIELQYKTAGIDSLSHWLDSLGGTVRPTLEKMPEIFRQRLLTELNTLSAVVNTVNGHLAEGNVPVRFTPLEDIPADATTEELIQRYSAVVAVMSVDSTKLFDLYVAAVNALNVLLKLENVTPPVGPAPLLASHEYVTVMRLIAEEYWLNLQLRNKDEFSEKLNRLTESLAGLREVLGSADQQRDLDTIIDSVEGKAPAESVFVLAKMKDLVTLVGSILDRSTSSAETIRKTVEAFDSSALRLMRMETNDFLDRLVGARDELASTPPSLDELFTLLSKIVPLVVRQSSSRARDEQSLIMIAQYPVAKSLIQHLLIQGKPLKMQDLPFKPEAAAFYARLYAATNRTVKYDEDENVLVVPAA